MHFELYAGPAYGLDPAWATAAGRLSAEAYFAVVNPTERFAATLGLAPDSPAFARERERRIAQMAVALTPVAADHTVAILATVARPGQVTALAMIRIVRGTRPEPALDLAGCPDSSLPSSRTYADWSFPPGIDRETPEYALAEFSAHVRHLRPRDLVTAGTLTSDEARGIELAGANAVMVAAYRHEVRRRGAPVAFFASTSPKLTLREPVLTPLFLPLFTDGVALTPGVTGNPGRFDYEYFRQWPDVLRRLVPDVDAIGVPAALRQLAHTPGMRWEQLPELCLPYLILNDAAFAAAIDAIERDCRPVGLPTEPTAPPPPAPPPDLHPDR